MAADPDAGMETCPSPEIGDSRKRPLDSDTENGSTKRSHFSSGKWSSKTLCLSRSPIICGYFFFRTFFYLILQHITWLHFYLLLCSTSTRHLSVSFYLSWIIFIIFFFLFTFIIDVYLLLHTSRATYLKEIPFKCKCFYVQVNLLVWKKKKTTNCKSLFLSVDISFLFQSIHSGMNFHVLRSFRFFYFVKTKALRSCILFSLSFVKFSYWIFLYFYLAFFHVLFWFGVSFFTLNLYSVPLFALVCSFDCAVYKK